MFDRSVRHKLDMPAAAALTSVKLEAGVGGVASSTSPAPAPFVALAVAAAAAAAVAVAAVGAAVVAVIVVTRKTTGNSNTDRITTLAIPYSCCSC